MANYDAEATGRLLLSSSKMSLKSTRPTRDPNIDLIDESSYKKARAYATLYVKNRDRPLEYV